MEFANDFGAEITAELLGDALIPGEKVIRWIDAATDLSTLAKLYRLTDEAYYRIQPDLGREASCALIQRYSSNAFEQESPITTKFRADTKLPSHFMCVSANSLS